MKKKIKKRAPKKMVPKKKQVKNSRRVDRFWGLAKRLEHTRIKRRNSQQPGKEK